VWSADEHSARVFLALRYPDFNEVDGRPPWLSPNLVRLKETIDATPGQYRDGRIMVHYREDSGATTVSEGTPPGTPPTFPRLPEEGGGGIEGQGVVHEIVSPPSGELQFSGGVPGVDLNGPPSREPSVNRPDSPVQDFKRRLIADPRAVAQQTQFVIEQTENQLVSLREQRSNAPEAADAIKRLESFVSMLREFQKGIEDGSPDQSASRFQRMMGKLLDDLEQLLGSGVLVKTTFMGVVFITASAFGVGLIGQAVIAASAIGSDTKLLERAKTFFRWNKDKEDE